MSGRSFATTSARRLTPSRTRKIHRDQNPRRFARKLWSRRRVSGLRRLPVLRSATSGVPSREVDTRVDRHVREVTDQVQQEADERVDVERAKHDRVVAVDRRLEAEEPESVEGEDHLDEERAGQEDSNEGRREAG